MFKLCLFVFKISLLDGYCSVGMDRSFHQALVDRCWVKMIIIIIILIIIIKRFTILSIAIWVQFVVRETGFAVDSALYSFDSLHFLLRYRWSHKSRVTTEGTRCSHSRHLSRSCLECTKYLALEFNSLRCPYFWVLKKKKKEKKKNERLCLCLEKNHTLH